ncbi:hypothetical protein D3C87_78460 [compost metagenome]
MARKQTVKEKMIALADHMLEHGWEVNHEFLNNFDDENATLEKLIYGKVGEYEIHLITKDKKFTAKFSNKRLHIFKKEPKWKKYGNFPIGQIELTKDGFAYVKKNEIMIQTTEFIVKREGE